MHILELEMHINEWMEAYNSRLEKGTEAIHAHLISCTGHMAVWPIKWSGSSAS